MEEREPDLLEPIPLYDCWHSFTSMLIQAGVKPEATQEFMGRRLTPVGTG